jgi:hypothetical protein
MPMPKTSAAHSQECVMIATHVRREDLPASAQPLPKYSQPSFVPPNPCENTTSGNAPDPPLG